MIDYTIPSDNKLYTALILAALPGLSVCANSIVQETIPAPSQVYQQQEYNSNLDSYSIMRNDYRISINNSIDEASFNYDLERMDRMVNCEYVRLPDELRDPEEILQWMLSV